jgi:hypothetical protein
MVFGQSPYNPNEYNPDIGGMSMFYGGAGIMDPRTPYTYLPGEAQSAPDYGWLGFDNITTVNAVPYTKAVGAIVASANATSATLTLVSASSATTGVYITTSMTRADTGAVDAGPLVALDAYTSVTASFSNGVMTITANSAMPVAPGMVVISTTGTVSQGTAAGSQVISQLTGGTGGQGVAGTYQMSNNLTATSGTVVLAIQTPSHCTVPNNALSPGVNAWNAMTLYGRAVAVTAAASATATTATVNGYDCYGYPLSEAITLTAGSQVSGKKAFKYIKSVVLNAADSTHAYSVDTTDLFGLPLRSDSFGDVLVNYASSLTGVTLITAATTYVASDRTTATSTTGDVRGTYGAFTSSTGANKLIIRQSPQAYMTTTANPGLYGVTQYSGF